MQFCFKMQTRKMINPLIRMQKIIKLGAYIDSEVLREYPDLKNNHTLKRNLDQRTQKTKQTKSLAFFKFTQGEVYTGSRSFRFRKGRGFQALHRGLALCVCRRCEGWTVSLFSHRESARRHTVSLCQGHENARGEK